MSEPEHCSTPVYVGDRDWTWEVQSLRHERFFFFFFFWQNHYSQITEAVTNFGVFHILFPLSDSIKAKIPGS